MIQTSIEIEGTQKVTDFLGDDGQIRTATWPSVIATFTHIETGEIVGHRVYTLRERSAFETMDQIQIDAIAAADQLASMLKELEETGLDGETLALLLN